MQRNWDMVREILLEVSALKKGSMCQYYLSHRHESPDIEKAACAISLFKEGFIDGIDISSLDGEGFNAVGLTWAGYALLEEPCNQKRMGAGKVDSQRKGFGTYLGYGENFG